MKVLLTGGGTGGHITPLLAVAHELKRSDSEIQTVYVGERGGKFLSLVKNHDDIDAIKLIQAGKFRRYHGESWLKRLLDVRTNLLNLRDAGYFLIGIFEALVFLLKNRPDAIFIKGGFVGVPVGIAAALLRVPFMTHDSDTVPGLANRIVGRWAGLHAVGMPAEFYNYPLDKTHHVGIPLSADFRKVDAAQKEQYRRELEVPTDYRVIFVTGGSQGAQGLNRTVALAAEALLAANKKIYILHQAGKQAARLYEGRAVDSQRLKVIDFAPDLYRYSGAADVIISRAGATSIAEFAVQGRACILVPHPHLAGGHQIKNAQHLEEAGAALVLSEARIKNQPEILVDMVLKLIEDETARQILADNLGATAKPDAAERIAQLVMELAG